MAEPISIQQLKDASLDVKSLEEVVNGDENVVVTTRLGETYPSVKGSIKKVFENGGLPATPFETKALMEASALVDGDYAQVTDGDDDNGLYVKEAGAWVKSAYDPVQQAKDYVSIEFEAVKGSVQELSSKVELDLTDPNNIAVIKDINGTDVFRITKAGRYEFLGLGDDLATVINQILDVIEQLKPSIGTLTLDKNSGAILEVRDANGVVSFRQDSNGHLNAPKIGDLTQTILNLISDAEYSSSKNVGAKYADYALAHYVDSYKVTDYLLKATDFNALGLVSHTVNIIRIPAITRLSQYGFLVFFEARSDFGGDDGVTSIGQIDFAIDPVTYALTKGTPRVIQESLIEGGERQIFMQPVGVKIDDGTLICMYTKQTSATQNKLQVKKSTDGGVNWSAAEDISYVQTSAGLGASYPCSQGLVKRYGRHKGRIVFPVWQRGVPAIKANYRSGYVYSDDNGVTWEAGEFAPYTTANEVQIAEDINGDMLFSIRQESKAPAKLLSMYSDKAKKYSRIYPDKSLTAANIMGGLIQGDNDYDFSPAKFTITTAKNEGRTEMLIHTSYDGGKNWATHLLPETIGKPIAYTGIDNITATHKLLVWESGGTKDLSYSVLTIDNFIKGDI